MTEFQDPPKSLQVLERELAQLQRHNVALIGLSAALEADLRRERASRQAWAEEAVRLELELERLRGGDTTP